MKIFYKSYVIINSVIYCALSVIFLLIQSAIVLDSSLLNIKFLLEYFVLGMPIVILAIITTQQLIQYKKNSKFFFVILAITVVLVTAYNLLYEFDKLVLMSLFFYTLIAYYFYQFIESELNESFVTPNYSKFRLFRPNGINIKIIIDNGSNSYVGLLTNWSDVGGFVYFDEAVKISPKDKIQIELSFQRTIFMSKASVVSMVEGKKGIGFKVDKTGTNDKSLNWGDFNSLTNIMGFDPKKVI